MRRRLIVVGLGVGALLALLGAAQLTTRPHLQVGGRMGRTIPVEAIDSRSRLERIVEDPGFVDCLVSRASGKLEPVLLREWRSRGFEFRPWTTRDGKVMLNIYCPATTVRYWNWENWSWTSTTEPPEDGPIPRGCGQLFEYVVREQELVPQLVVECIDEWIAARGR